MREFLTVCSNVLLKISYSVVEKPETGGSEKATYIDLSTSVFHQLF